MTAPNDAPMMEDVLSDDGFPADGFPPRLAGVLADLSGVMFRREMLPSGEIRYPWMSPNCLNIFGFEPSQMGVGSKGALNVIHWADRDVHVAAIQRSGVTMERCLEAFRVITAEGETRWLRGSSAPMRMADGRIVWDGAWIDISPWMRAEHQYQTVMDHAEDCILTLDTNNGIEWMNAAAERLFGWTLDEMSGRCMCHVMAAPCMAEPPAFLALCAKSDITECFAHGTHEMQARRKNGTTFPFEMTVSEVRSDGRLSLIVIGRDITRRKATEAMLEETELRLHTIAGNLPGVVFQRVLEPNGQFSYPYVSEGIEEILGGEARHIVANPMVLFEAMVDDDRRRLMEELVNSADSLEPVDEDVRVRSANGRLRWLSGQSRPRRRGETIVWDGLLLDVTDEVEERLNAEQAIRESEERFRLAFDAASLGIVVTAKDGTIKRSNPAFQKLSANSGDDLARAAVESFIETLALSSATTEAFSLECQPRLPDGRERHWRISGTPFAATPTDTDHSLLFVIEDVTEVVMAAEERRQLELALTEGQKLEALGRLAGGVAHELNNMLGPILMAAEMLMRSAPLDQRNKERCGRVIEAAKHGREIVRNVLAYCRKETKALAPVDIVPVFSQFAGLASSILPPGIKVETRIGPQTAIVTGDGGQLTQLLLNLANNARDAMDGHGTLRLGLQVIEPARLKNPRGRAKNPLPDAFASLDPTFPHVEMIVGDTGCGMAPHTAAKIFDPFFTTKPVGQGTGLGLSVVQGIIKAMGGAIAVDSVPGHGTTFRIALPLLDQGALPKGSN